MKRNRILNQIGVIFVTFLLVFLSSQTVYAACVGSSPTWTTDGNESADVNECISVATAGDTINVIAGDGAASWGANAVTIPANKPLKVIGPGASNLTINMTGYNAFTIEAYQGSLLSPGARISQFRFVSPSESRYTAIIAKGQYWRIDHNTFQSIDTQPNTADFVIATGINTLVQPFGLIDNNTIINGKIDVIGGMGYALMSAAWADALNLGGPTAVYVEDNTWSISGTSNKKLAMDSYNGGKYVFRYNKVVGYDLLAHGLQSEDGRGARKWEVYGNTFDDANSTAYEVFNPKAGTGVFFYNDTTCSSGSFSYYFHPFHERSTWSVGPTGGMCNGNGPWDKNSDSTGWHCRDQVGAGIDASAWVGPYTSNTAPQQTKTPAYVWSIVANNSLVSPMYTVDAKDQNYIKPNRDFYAHVASFNGTTGMGCGTLDNRPATCTKGVAYWETNQSCTNMTGMVGANPSTPISGRLYKCTSTNTWEASYTPYTYPHPLRK